MCGKVREENKLGTERNKEEGRGRGHHLGKSHRGDNRSSVNPPGVIRSEDLVYLSAVSVAHLPTLHYLYTPAAQSPREYYTPPDFPMFRVLVNLTTWYNITC